MTRALRAECAALLCAPCFIKRDESGQALFVSDLPRKPTDIQPALARLAEHGFSANVTRGLLYIDLTPERYAALAASLPLSPIPDALPPEARSICLRLARVSTPPEKQPISPIRLALVHLDKGDISGLCDRLAPALAVLQREHAPLPSCIAGLIIRFAEIDRF